MIHDTVFISHNRLSLFSEDVESTILGLLTVAGIRSKNMDFIIVPDYEAQVTSALHNPSTLGTFSSYLTTPATFIGILL
jgi:hypothetical protein